MPIVPGILLAQLEVIALGVIDLEDTVDDQNLLTTMEVESSIILDDLVRVTTMEAASVTIKEVMDLEEGQEEAMALVEDQEEAFSATVIVLVRRRAKAKEKVEAGSARGAREVKEKEAGLASVRAQKAVRVTVAPMVAVVAAVVGEAVVVDPNISVTEDQAVPLKAKEKDFSPSLRLVPRAKDFSPSLRLVPRAKDFFPNLRLVLKAKATGRRVAVDLVTIPREHLDLGDLGLATAVWVVALQHTVSTTDLVRAATDLVHVEVAAREKGSLVVTRPLPAEASFGRSLVKRNTKKNPVWA